LIIIKKLVYVKNILLTPVEVNIAVLKAILIKPWVNTILLW